MCQHHRYTAHRSALSSIKRNKLEILTLFDVCCVDDLKKLLLLFALIQFGAQRDFHLSASNSSSVCVGAVELPPASCSTTSGRVCPCNPRHSMELETTRLQDRKFSPTQELHPGVPMEKSRSSELCQGAMILSPRTVASEMLHLCLAMPILILIFNFEICLRCRNSNIRCF